MSKITALDTLEDDTGRVVARILPAEPEAVELVLGKSEDDEEGRSNWVWVRLPNGDLILGVFPQGDTYELVTQTMIRGEV